MISVIVPIYNTEKYLKRCLDSIINQTYKDLEIILINDGSTDDSLNICKKYEAKDKRIKVLNQVNQGQGVARNYGLSICSGDYIAFVDSDDYIKNDMYEKMLYKIKKYNADMAICGYSRDHAFLVKEPKTPQEDTIYNNLDLIKAYISTPYITTSVCNKLYKKELWKEYRFSKIRAREDVTILHKVLSNVNTAVHIGESSYIQYVRPGSTERRVFSIDKLNSIQASKSRTKFIMNNYPQLNKYIFLNNAKTYVNLMEEIMRSFSYNKYKREYKEMLNMLEIELMQHYDLRYLDIDLYNKFKEISENQYKFMILATISGIKDRVLNILTKFAFEVNRIRKCEK